MAIMATTFYGIVGALYGLAVESRRIRSRVTLSVVLLGPGWHYLSYALRWRNRNPLLTLYTHPGPMVAGPVDGA
jgi:hypothetical protein